MAEEKKKFRGPEGKVTLIGMTPEKAYYIRKVTAELYYKHLGYDVTVTVTPVNE